MNTMTFPRLFLFCDHKIPANRGLDDRVLAAVGKSNPLVAWIPSGARPEKTDEFFANRRAYYAELGVTNVEMFALHRDFREDRIPWLLSCDIIHLSGGDAFTFLPLLRKTRILDALHGYASRGGILVGDCGGAMLMARDIEICLFGKIPPPPGLKDLSALGLVDFEFHPHLGTYGADLETLREYSRRKSCVVYAAPDGAGLSVLGKEIKPHGKVTRIINGTAEVLDAD